MYIFSKLSMAQKYNVETKKFLSDFQYGQILELSHIDELRGANTKYGVAQYSTVWESVRETGKLLLCERMLGDSTISPPVVMGYFGAKTTESGASHYNIKVWPCENAKEMKQTAKTLRGKDPKELEETIMARNFNQFEEGSVLVIASVEQQNAICEGVATDVDVGNYELLDNQGDVYETGQVYIPGTIKNLCCTRVPVSLLYMGSKLMLSGRKQLDIKVITDERSVYFTAMTSPSTSQQSSPPAKRKTSDSIVDVSDDEVETKFTVTF